MAYIFLAFSIISEVFGSTMLKLSNGFKKLFPVLGVAIGYMISFYLLSLTLTKLPLTFTYAAWSGVGTVLTTIVGVFLFKEHLNLKGIIGIILIIVGVVMLNIV